MPTLESLGTDALKVALNAADTLMGHTRFMPRSGLLAMLLGRFRDDVREALEMDAEDIPRRGKDHQPLDQMTSGELDAVWGAAMILLQDRFTRHMDDPDLPKLLRAFQGELAVQRGERAQIRAEMAS